MESSSECQSLSKGGPKLFCAGWVINIWVFFFHFVASCIGNKNNYGTISNTKLWAFQLQIRRWGWGKHLFADEREIPWRGCVLCCQKSWMTAIFLLQNLNFLLEISLQCARLNRLSPFQVTWNTDNECWFQLYLSVVLWDMIIPRTWRKWCLEIVSDRSNWEKHRRWKENVSLYTSNWGSWFLSVNSSWIMPKRYNVVLFSFQ